MMETIKTSNSKQILRILEGNSRNEIIALCVYLNARTDYEIPVYGSKTQLLMGLKGVETAVLRESIHALFSADEDECDDEEEEDDCDEADSDSEDSEEEEDDDEDE